jgi:hypothetical protein
MASETKQDILNWYERQPRTLTDDFISSIAWDDVRRHPFDARFIPVLTYMRDVEALTDMYYMEMRRTPTGRDPVISQFMERWGFEELAHAEVLNRFLGELGVRMDDDWKTKLRQSVSNKYRFKTYLVDSLTNLIGTRFTATHMAFGAIHEMTTAQGYRRVMDLAKHPVLTTILRAIIREESAHTQFYWRVARLELEDSATARLIARQVIQHFWYPVGQGSKPKGQTENLVSALFGQEDGLGLFDTTITRRVQRLPGFAGVDRTTKKIAEICHRHQVEPFVNETV